MDSNSGKTYGSGAVFIAFTLIGWSSVPLFLKYFTQSGHYIDGWTANGWRYGVSAAIWAPLLLVGALRKRLPPGLWRAALVPSLANCLGQVCFAWTPYFIGPGLQSFLIRFQIIVVALGAYLLFPSERDVLRSTRYWLGIMLVFGGSVGTFVLAKEPLTGESAVGVALGIVSGLLFGGYALAVRYYMHGISATVSFAAISQYTAAVMLVIMLIFADGRGAVPLTFPIGDLGLLLLSAVVGIALGHVFYYASIARLGVSIAAGVILVAPFITSVASEFIYGEHLVMGQWLSGLVAMLGAAAILSTRFRPRGGKAAAVLADQGELGQDRDD